MISRREGEGGEGRGGETPGGGERPLMTLTDIQCATRFEPPSIRPSKNQLRRDRQMEEFCEGEERKYQSETNYKVEREQVRKLLREWIEIHSHLFWFVQSKEMTLTTIDGSWRFHCYEGYLRKVKDQSGEGEISKITSCIAFREKTFRI